MTTPNPNMEPQMPDTETGAADVSVVDQVEKNPVAVFTNEKLFGEFVAKVRAEVDAFEPDLTTDKGRKAIASLAYKVSQSKTALDEAGKALTEEKRAENRAHRSRIMAAAKVAIMKHGGVEEEAARKIVLAIGAGEVPAVAITF